MPSRGNQESFLPGMLVEASRPYVFKKKCILHAMSMIRRNASKLGTRISEAEDVRKAVSASFLNNHARTVAFALIPVARY